ERLLTRRSRIFAAGSCFAVNIHRRMRRNKLPSECNPFGPLYNPASICRALTLLEEGHRYTADDLFNRDGLYCHYDFHTSACGPDPTETLRGMNMAVDTGRKALMAADAVIITLGTSFVYTLKSDGQTVANCNKMPAALFDRSMLSPETIRDMLLEKLSAPIYKDKTVILTVSPIRHLSDGLAANSRSKAHLITAACAVADRLPGAVYFPSYEIMYDELRDYRFYADDMIHPSEAAADYIWERFFEAAYDDETHAYVAAVAEIRKGAEHRPFNPQSQSYKDFAAAMLRKIASLKARYPEAPLEEEVSFFQKIIDRI
ncbi:MAG: GSCFA domain-containing protein, partial [Rikenellaceae bacterium]|nr:GSCFA domain-containing protein [Rikenellaceae bacterium]